MSKKGTMSMRVKYCMIALVALTGSFADRQVDAQSAGKKDALAATVCTDVDFWAGVWEVDRLDGAKVATVSIELSNGHESAYVFPSFVFWMSGPEAVRKRISVKKGKEGGDDASPKPRLTECIVRRGDEQYLQR